MAELEQDHESYELGMHTEQLSGRTQQVFFSAEESDNLVYPWAPQVDFEKTGEIDADSLDQRAVNQEISRLMNEGVGTITVRNPGAKHSLGVGILSRLNLHFDGSLGYFGCGLLDRASAASRQLAQTPAPNASDGPKTSDCLGA